MYEYHIVGVEDVRLVVRRSLQVTFALREFIQAHSLCDP